MTFETQFHYREGRFAFAEASMGTVFVFQGHSPLSEVQTQVVCEQALQLIHEADRTFSLYKPESPLSRLARGETSVAECPPVVAQIWEECEAWEKETAGWFSSFTPQHTFDPSGLVKTWAAQRAAQHLLNSGIVDFTMNAGGDIYLSDALTTERDWKIALSKPVSIADQDAGIMTVLDLRGTQYRAVCTSGSAERGSHIWNPKAGEDQSELVQVTVVAVDLVEADVWATAAFAEGPRSIERLAKRNESHPDNQIQALAVYADGTLIATPGFQGLVARP